MSVVATSYSLSIREIPLEEYAKFLPLTEEWLLVAEKKRLDAEEADAEIFETSRFVINGIKNIIHQVLKVNTLMQTSLFICLGDKTTVQGMGFFNKKNCFISWIASHPDNLLHPINDLTKRIRGVGTTLIYHFAQIAKEKKSPILLSCKPPSDLFYIKLGFEKINQVNMRLSLEKIEELVSKEL